MLQITNANVLDVFTQTFEHTDLWIEADKVVFRGKTESLTADEVFDANNAYIAPGLIDAHMHIESSLLRPAELGRLLASHGVTTAIADPHELASVTGAEGIQFMLDDSEDCQTDFRFMLPSSVPAVSFEHAGAILKAADLKPFYEHPRVNGLAEVMDYPAVASKEADMMQKITDALAENKRIDGHGAGLTRDQLSVYRKVGISTDHEATSIEEVKNRLEAGMHVLIRQGTVEQDEVNLLPAVIPSNQHRFSFSTDDKTVTDIMAKGSIDDSVRIAIDAGIPTEITLSMASYNAAQAEGLQNIGALNDGFRADLIVFDDLKNFEVKQVMSAGNWVHDNGNATDTAETTITPLNFTLTKEKLETKITSNQTHVMGVVPNHITTEHIVTEVPTNATADFMPNETYQKLVVAERYQDRGSSVGIISGFGLRQGAIGATVAHDSHNVIIAGVSDAAMLKAADALREMNGGLVVVIDEDNVITVPLSIGGVMSNQPYDVVAQQYEDLQCAFKEISNVTFDPFITLSFMALPVIPTLKLTDQGLFDFEKFEFIELND